MPPLFLALSKGIAVTRTTSSFISRDFIVFSVSSSETPIFSLYDLHLSLQDLAHLGECSCDIDSSQDQLGAI